MHMTLAQKTASLSIRILADDRRALERAASREDRSVAAVVRRILAEWRATQQPEKRAQ
jgi:uncharacterized protein (DUF1778 family)